MKGPKALRELQGYVYDAWQRMATIFDHLGESACADECRSGSRNMIGFQAVSAYTLRVCVPKRLRRLRNLLAYLGTVARGSFGTMIILFGG